MNPNWNIHGASTVYWSYITNCGNVGRAVQSRIPTLPAIENFVYLWYYASSNGLFYFTIGCKISECTILYSYSFYTSKCYHEKLKYLLKSPKKKIRILIQKIFHPVVYLLALKTMLQKHIDFLNKNQCQKSAVINVSIIYFHTQQKVTFYNWK